MFRPIAILSAALAVTACNVVVSTSSAAALSCDQLAEKAKASTQAQGTPVSSITDIQEISATPAERRCSGMAHAEMGSAQVYFRGVESDDSVEIRETPFE